MRQIYEQYIDKLRLVEAERFDQSQYDLEEWASLIKDRDQEAMVRAKSNEQLEESKCFITATLYGIEQELGALALKALNLAQGHWEEASERVETSEKAKFGTRVRYVRDLPQITWYKPELRRVKGKERKFRISAGHIRANGDTYDRRVFRDASEWERELIEEIETEYRKIRKQIRHLVTARKELKKYAKMLKAQEEQFGVEE